MPSANLGKLERKVMEIVWAQKNSSVRQVLNKLGKDHKRAYTTIATVLNRLHTKGLLGRIEQDSVYFYFLKLSRELYSKSVARSFIDNFVRYFCDFNRRAGFLGGSNYSSFVTNSNFC